MVSGKATAIANNGSFWKHSEQLLERHPILILTSVYVFCVLVFLASVPFPHVDGHLVGSDGAFYYAYLPTLLLDHDLDFRNQYASLVPEKNLSRIRESVTGRLPNKWAIGSAVLWTPFFLIGHLLAMGMKAAGYAVQLDGMGYVYQVPTLIGSITYGFAGFLLIYRSCRRFFKRSSSALATVWIWLASSVIYYTTAESSMSHACSLFATALFLALWLEFRPMPKLHQWFFLGLSGGLVLLVRQPDATWLLLPVIDALWAFRRHLEAPWRSRLAGFLVYGAAACVVFAPQMAVWRILHGAVTQSGYPQGGHAWHLDTGILRMLFSLKHGLYAWHPVLILATIGIVLLYRTHRVHSLLLGLGFLFQVCLVGIWQGWSGGDAFGGRMLISSIPAMALGLAAFVDWSFKRDATRGVLILACALILWNGLFFVQYRFGYISKRKTITVNELFLGKFQMLKDIAGRIQDLIRR